MSEFINNREKKQNDDNRKFRQEKLKELILRLHDNEDFNTVKKEFEEVFGKISATEISELEQELIREGMKVEEVQRLCDVHSAVFKGSIDEIHGYTSERVTEGHPINTMLIENEAIGQFINIKFMFHLDLFKDHDNEQTRGKLKKDLRTLYEIDKHYLRKENLLFPYLEKYGVYGPAKVMWGVDDEIRKEIKDTIKMIEDRDSLSDAIVFQIEELIHKVNEMIFKEEKILLPMTEEKLTQDEWFSIQEESDNLGYTFIEQPDKWIPKKIDDGIDKEPTLHEHLPDGKIRFETGLIGTKELEFMLNAMPVDLTFIDQDDVVRYFSNGTERIFPRTKAVIGRTVQNCHPPQSVHMVEKLLRDFKNGKKEVENFWIQMRGMFVYIRYFAVRDHEGNYLGTLEFTENIKGIKELEGEKRLLSDDE
ncbi:DUF438 domain-containing protein [Haloplasma contractile]|uniref:PAS domain protein n=1 Tax=Haloplasma contractile SSD-17B TaxID=1033810 RepID=F7Q1F7_9MOLU|nr:DUF438 domain-containing protein [Haloplasma contractile]ERJ12876.1 PAS domain protein [Haloplasma contractile SSD-17B]